MSHTEDTNEIAFSRYRNLDLEAFIVRELDGDYSPQSIEAIEAVAGKIVSDPLSLAKLDFNVELWSKMNCNRVAQMLAVMAEGDAQASDKKSALERLGQTVHQFAMDEAREYVRSVIVQRPIVSDAA